MIFENSSDIDLQINKTELQESDLKIKTSSVITLDSHSGAGGAGRGWYRMGSGGEDSQNWVPKH